MNKATWTANKAASEPYAVVQNTIAGATWRKPPQPTGLRDSSRGPKDMTHSPAERGSLGSRTQPQLSMSGGALALRGQKGTWGWWQKPQKSSNKNAGSLRRLLSLTGNHFSHLGSDISVSGYPPLRHCWVDQDLRLVITGLSQLMSRWELRYTCPEGISSIWEDSMRPSWPFTPITSPLQRKSISEHDQLTDPPPSTLQYVRKTHPTISKSNFAHKRNGTATWAISLPSLQMNL